MKIRKEKVLTFELTLNQAEAEWLRGLVQNPMCDPIDEPEEVSKYRKLIFDGLNPS